MTYAPKKLLDLQAYWRAQKGTSLGIVGDVAHAKKGVSYHLGKSQLTATAYSRRTARDKAGLTEAASAIDLGRLDGSLTQLRAFSAWFAGQCKAGKAGYDDVREVIWWDQAGGVVLGWSDLSPKAYIRNYGDLTHKTHTHISYYRDSEKRDKTAMFRPYFQEADMGIAVYLLVTKDADPYDALGTAKLKVADVQRVKDGAAVSLAAGTDLGVVQRGTRLDTNVAIVALNHAGELHVAPFANVTYTALPKPTTPPPTGDDTPFDQADLDAAFASGATGERDRIAEAEADRIRHI